MLQLFTDTSANLPVALTKQHHITVVPFSYTVDGKETDYPDDVDFDGAAFYGAMRSGAIVKTSMVSPALMEEYFERALSAGDDVLYVGMSGGISGTAQAAAIAAGELTERYPERRIVTIDTYAASLGEGLQVLEAAEQRIYAIRQGRSANGMEHISGVMASVWETIKERQAQGAEFPGISTGLIDLDRRISGLNESDLLILAARPAMGKTSLALNIALEAGKHVIVEKPMAVTAAETEELAALAQRKRLFLFEAMTTQYQPNYAKLRELLPRVLTAGEQAGTLTEAGAALLGGKIPAGIPVAPPEGDAGTGMTATNSVAPRTGNVSAGTSIFSMVVLERPLERVYPEIDLVTTPDGAPVAMVHCNNCTSDLNAWVELLAQNAELCGAKVNKGELFTKLFNLSLQGAPDCGGVIPVNYYSGEGVTHFDAGRPMLLRGPESDFSLANLMRANIYSAFATLAIGLDILNEEHVTLDTLLGHGGLFKTPGVAQRYLAAAAHTAVTCTETAGEGGPYGMALLAAYRVEHADGETLANYLQNRVFAGAASTTLNPDAADEAGFAAFLKEYKKALCAERTAVETM